MNEVHNYCNLKLQYTYIHIPIKSSLVGLTNNVTSSSIYNDEPKRSLRY